MLIIGCLSGKKKVDKSQNSVYKNAIKIVWRGFLVFGLKVGFSVNLKIDNSNTPFAYLNNHKANNQKQKDNKKSMKKLIVNTSLPYKWYLYGILNNHNSSYMRLSQHINLVYFLIN